MSAHVNLTAYEGVENIERFNDGTFKKYCADKLASCDKHIAFIQKYISLKQLNVLEVGSGSGKLLFRLEKENMLTKGVGFETSGSRKMFSDKFSGYVNSNKVETYNVDYLQSELEHVNFDIIIGIDVVINLIGGIGKSYIDDFFKKSLRYLAPDGTIILESITLERETDAIKRSENGIFRTWKFFAESDPFKYGLDQMSLDELDNLVWNKYFIERNTNKEEQFTNILKPMCKEDFVQIADKYELTVSFFDRWNSQDDTSDEEFIAVFKK